LAIHTARGLGESMATTTAWWRCVWRDDVIGPMYSHTVTRSSSSFCAAPAPENAGASDW